MRTVILLIFVWGLMTAGPAFADTVFLKNGKIVQGDIVENTGYAVRINVDGNIRTYFGTEILRILKEGENILEASEEDKRDMKVPSDKRELILRLLEANNVRDSINRLVLQITSKAPPETLERVRELLKTDAVLERIIPIYNKYYTKEELEELLQFYKSPVGSKHLKTTPLIMEQTMKELMKYVQEQSEGAGGI